MLFTHLDLEPGEKIVHEIRRHWIVFIGHIFITVFLLIMPLILYIVALAFLPNEAVHTVTKYFFISLFVYAIWFLLVWIMLFIQWTNYYLDVWYITEKRIIDIQQKGIFHREVSNLRFDKIQDISVEVRGVVATFLKYGDLRVQTASEDSRSFTIRNASRPEQARKIIFEMHNQQSLHHAHAPTPVSGPVVSVR